jgi:TolA-binding protein
MRKWKLTLVVPLVAAFVLVPARAADPEIDKVKRLQEDLDKLRKEVESLREDIRTMNLRGQVAALNMQELKDSLQSISRKLDGMIPAQATRSQSFSYTPSTSAAPPATGIVYLRNSYPFSTATITINGTPYTVGPGQVVTLRDVPLGPFTYEAFVAGYTTGPRQTTLTAQGENINVFPQP